MGKIKGCGDQAKRREGREPHLLGVASRAGLLSASAAKPHAGEMEPPALLRTSQPTMKSSRAGISQALASDAWGSRSSHSSQASAKPALTKNLFFTGKRI